MPLPVIAATGAVVAAKHLAYQALTFVDVYTLTFTIIFTRLLWVNIPPWIKEDISFRRLASNKTQREELTHLGSIINKMQALVKASEGIEPVSQVHAALLAYIQIAGQIKYREVNGDSDSKEGDTNCVDDSIKKGDGDEHEANAKGNDHEEKTEVDSDEANAKGDDDEANTDVDGDEANTEVDDGEAKGDDDEANETADMSVAPLTAISTSTSLSSKADHPVQVETRDDIYYRSGTVLEDFQKDLDDGDGRESRDDLRKMLQFSVWAYHEEEDILQSRLDDEGYTLLDHHLVTKPGYVGYYVAVSKQCRTIIVAIKGTSSLEDMLIDCCGRAVPFDDNLDFDQYTRIEVKGLVPNTVVPAPEGTVEIVSGHERIWVEQLDDDGCNGVYCHEGIFVCAQRLFQKIRAIVQVFAVDKKYRIRFCGHSLGASAAALAALLTKRDFPGLFEDIEGDTKDASGNDDDHDYKNVVKYKARESKNVFVYAFGPPPVLDHDTAIAVSSFCISIVDNADIIPRCSIQNLAVFLEVLRAVQVRLEAEGMSPVGPITTTALLKKLGEGLQGSMLLSKDELRVAYTDAFQKVGLRKAGHLYIPGKVVLGCHLWATSDVCGEKNVDEAKEVDDDDRKSTDETIWIDADGRCAALRVLEVDGLRMFTDHVCSSYCDLLGMEYSF